jgi:hypothetical protein
MGVSIVREARMHIQEYTRDVSIALLVPIIQASAVLTACHAPLAKSHLPEHQLAAAAAKGMNSQ